MKIFLSLVLFVSLGCKGQSADFIQLRKNNKTIQTFFSNQNIMLTTKSGAYIDALINGIKKDTLYLQEFVIRYLPTTFGTYIIDTAGSYHYKICYHDIVAIGRKEKTNFNVKGSGAALFGGGALLTVASGVVYLADREKFSMPLLLASAGLGTIGYFMAKGKKGGNAISVGNRYKLVYMDMSNEKR